MRTSEYPAEKNMPSDLTSILTALTERLLKLAEQDELVRSQLRQLAEAVLQATEPHSQPVVANSEGTEQTDADAVAAAPADTNPPASAGQQTDDPPPLPQLSAHELRQSANRARRFPN
jgi:hypothetical protein